MHWFYHEKTQIKYTFYYKFKNLNCKIIFFSIITFWSFVCDTHQVRELSKSQTPVSRYSSSTTGVKSNGTRYARAINEWFTPSDADLLRDRVTIFQCSFDSPCESPIRFFPPRAERLSDRKLRHHPRAWNANGHCLHLPAHPTLNIFPSSRYSWVLELLSLVKKLLKY